MMKDASEALKLLNEQCRHAFLFLCYYHRDLTAGEAAYEERYGDFILANAALEASLAEMSVRLADVSKKPKSEVEELKTKALALRAKLVQLASSIHNATPPLDGAGEARLRARLAKLSLASFFTPSTESYFSRLEEAYARGDATALDLLEEEKVPQEELSSTYLETRLAYFHEQCGRVAQELSRRRYREKLAMPVSRSLEAARLAEYHDELLARLACLKEELERLTIKE